MQVADRTDIVAYERKIMLLDGFVNAFYKTVCHLAGFLASVSLFNLADYGITRAAGDRRSSHCAAAHCLMYLLAFCFIQTCAEVLHNFFVAAYAACARITAGNDLAEDRDIGINAIITLRTGKADTETCNNLITNKQRAVFAAERLNALREVFINRTGCGFRAARLNEYSRSAAAEFVEDQFSFQALQIIREEFLRMFEYKERNTVRLRVHCSGNTHAPCKLI